MAARWRGGGLKSESSDEKMAPCFGDSERRLTVVAQARPPEPFFEVFSQQPVP